MDCHLLRPSNGSLQGRARSWGAAQGVLRAGSAGQGLQREAPAPTAPAPSLQVLPGGLQLSPVPREQHVCVQTRLRGLQVRPLPRELLPHGGRHKLPGVPCLLRPGQGAGERPARPGLPRFSRPFLARHCQLCAGCGVCCSPTAPGPSDPSRLLPVPTLELPIFWVKRKEVALVPCPSSPPWAKVPYFLWLGE